MPFNLLKKYNELLELVSLNSTQIKQSLLGVFNRDIVNNSHFKFRNKQIVPTPKDGVITMETLFTHLTTVITDKNTRRRDFDIDRSSRLHWVKYHINESKKENVLYFTVKEPEGYRTYIYDIDEKYVIILEPLRNKNEYYLLTAYYLTGKDEKRDKILKKYKRKIDELL
ncbi:MAG: hypothetical protein U0V72_08400 [Cytophagales bacterium]